MRRTIAIAVFSLLLVACAGSQPATSPSPTGPAAATPTQPSAPVDLAGTLAHILRATQPGAQVECPDAGPLHEGQAVLCSSSGPGRGQTALYVSVLADDGRFVFEEQTPYDPMDYPSQERSCRVLSQPPGNTASPAEIGLDYTGLLYFWMAAGRPASMDDDGNGVPCETVYPAGIVQRTLASPLRVEPYPVGEVSLDQVRAYAEAVINADPGYWTQGTLVCQTPQDTSLAQPATRGSTLLCHRETDRVRQEGAVGLTILDGTGRFAITLFECCRAGPWPDDYPADTTCTVLHAPPDDSMEFGFNYSQVLYWWALHGMPASFDDDGDGRPCEDVYPEAAVDAVLDNTLQPPA